MVIVIKMSQQGTSLKMNEKWREKQQKWWIVKATRLRHSNGGGKQGDRKTTSLRTLKTMLRVCGSYYATALRVSVITQQGSGTWTIKLCYPSGVGKGTEGTFSA